MSQPIESVLRDIVHRHGPVLLEDHRRCEACLRDTSLPQREIAGLLAALRSGIPARFLQFQASGLTAAAISNYATRLSDETGLRDDLARSSLEAWAHALRVPLPGTSQGGRVSGDEASEVKRDVRDENRQKDAAILLREEVVARDRAEADPISEPSKDNRRVQEKQVPPPLASVRGKAGWLPYLFLIQGALLLVAQGFPNASITIVTYVAGSLSILVAALLSREVQWIRWPAAALSVLLLLVAAAKWQLVAGILERATEREVVRVEAILPIIATGILAFASLVGSLLWNASARQSTGIAGQTDRIAVAVMFVALWCFFNFGIDLGGTISALRTGYVFHEKFIWFWAECAISFTLVVFAWSVLTGRRQELPYIPVAALFGAGAVSGTLYLIISQNFGGHDYWPWNPDLAKVIGIVASLGAAGASLYIWKNTKTSDAEERRKTPIA